jgi:hypothetical protein
MAEKITPKVVKSEIERAGEQFDKFDANVKELTLDRMNEAPKLETEGTKISQKELSNSKEIYLKPERYIEPKEKFNEKFRKAYEFAKEYVRFIASNNELRDSPIEMWTKNFAGINCEFWRVPVNKPVWGPRYLAEQIRKCSYHRLRMDEGRPTEETQVGTIVGAMVADCTINRLDATPAAETKSIFMGASSF